MKLAIKNIEIQDFKNIEHLKADLDDFVRIKGANETGKTTLADAISWCLTGKNSLGETTFKMIPANTKGLSPTVELTISMQQDKATTKTVVLQRTSQAKQNKEKEFTGEYQTICYINGIKQNIKDFETWVDNHICNKEVFRLVHDIKYFTENITPTAREKTWEAQRRLLLEICNIKPDSELIKKRKKFAPLADGLQQFDDAGQLMQLLKQSDKDITKKIATINAKITALDELQADCDNIESTSELAEQINKLVTRYNEIKTSFEKSAYMQQEQDALLRHRAIDLTTEINHITYISKNAVDDYKTAEASLAKLKDACPTCGQKLPESIMIAQKNKLIDEMAHQKEIYTRAIERRNNKNAELAGVQQKMKRWTVQVPPSSLDELNSQVVALKERLAKAEQAAKIEHQIKLLEENRTAALDDKSRVQQQLDLCREFIDYKCKYAEDKINSMFDGVTFKMFRQNKTNDEIKECCDIFWYGIPYPGLSYSTKFVVSLKIVQAFQRYYGIVMPIIVDNAESIDLGAKVEQQIILLVKEDENCPECGGQTGRKQANGLWKCQDCGYEFVKQLRIM